MNTYVHETVTAADAAAAPGGPQPGSIIHGDCIDVMSRMAPASVDFILTDPPYLVRYRDYSFRTVLNDDNDAWLKPAFAQMFRVLRDGTFCVSFYGWNHADRFIAAWRAAGFRIVGHIVFRKRYASSTRFLQHRHEQAYLLGKGALPLPRDALPDVMDWTGYTGNRLHPTQKPVEILRPLIGAFCPKEGVVLDPFCGSGSTLVAARDEGRSFLGVELDPLHHQTAVQRLRECV